MAPGLVLLHGFTHTGKSWDPMIRALGERYRAWAPDLRGHGSSARARPVDLDDVVLDVLVGAPTDRFVLAGYSMGGRIALHVALRAPERVAQLVLIGASPGLASAQQRAARVAADEALALRVERMSIEQFAEEWAACTPLLAGQSAGVRAAAREDRLRSTPPGLAAALRGLGTGALPSLWELLGDLPMPIVFVVGERDAKFRAITEDMAMRVRDGSVLVVPGVGHAVHLEAPEAVAAVL